MKRCFTRCLVVLLFLLAFNPIKTYAQDGDPPEDGCDIYDGCPVPLDTWAWLLAGSAAVYAFGKLNKHQQALPGKRDGHTIPQHCKQIKEQLSIQ
ncbi:hypothetical protein [Mucilaginibacter pedocola]|uniref:Uncharacterized protein n=1 Tax=Mucilaginibacter pedocola TaxID=1792845 RepID=A0A1S9PCD9_9SPHI|nr:hypothetical protein [Mucilaginibacter pedocola]OOQ58248.1 hypothetical protein BC343_11440 [Mucilaginibacter pedocola]